MNNYKFNQSDCPHERVIQERPYHGQWSGEYICEDCGESFTSEERKAMQKEKPVATTDAKQTYREQLPVAGNIATAKKYQTPPVKR